MKQGACYPVYSGQAMESCLPRIALIADGNHVKCIVVLSNRAAEPALVHTHKIKCFSIAIAVLLTVLSNHQVKIWEEKAKALIEERAKQRSALETELRTLKAAQDDIAARFDESLLALQTVSSPSCCHIFSQFTCASLEDVQVLKSCIPC